MHLPVLLLASYCCFFVFLTHRVLVDIDLQEHSIWVLLTELDKDWANHLAGTAPTQAGTWSRSSGQQLVKPARCQPAQQLS
jgi:hypothetical protein